MRCQGSGEVVTLLGKPDPDRNTHAAYEGIWCVYPTRRCPVCGGKGKRNARPNRSAGMRIVFDENGWVTDRSGFPDRKES